MPEFRDAPTDPERQLGREKGYEESASSDEYSRVEFSPPKRRGCCSSLTKQLTLHLCLAAIYITVFFAYWDYKGYGCPNGHKTGLKAYSPAWEALKWEPRILQNEIEIKSPFKGLPRPEMDEAWNKLLAPTAIRLSKEELEKLNRTSVALDDGSGYMGGLDVYHQLHCIRYVRRYLHQEYYNMTKEKNMGQHIDHCLDSLRQYVMCNADVSILTFDWIPNFHRPWPNFRMVHECANWDSLEEWALARGFNGKEDSLLTHPNFHPELPNPFDYTASGNDV